MNYNFNNVPPDTYISVIKNQHIRPRFRLSLLYQDESFKEDISEYLIQNSGTLNINYAQGQRRSLNFKLDNSSKKFTPKGIQGDLWINTKFKLELGVEMDNGDIIWNSAGIFIIGNPNAIRQNAEKTIDIQCYDKFALLDGTLGGVLDATYQVNVDTNIKNVLQITLLQDNGNGFPIDTKPLVFDSEYKDEVTQYTLSKSANDSYGQIFIELANMISCDIYYGVDGNLVVKSGTKDISQVDKPILWKYNDNEYEYVSSSVSYDFTKVKNRVTVVGANANGENIYIGVSENENPESSTRVSIIGVKNMYIEDSNIFSDELAQQRAGYELNKICMVQQAVQVSSTYMIHLDVNSCISLTDNFFDYKDARFIIQSISIPIGVNSNISLDCTNITNLPYYPTA